MNRDIPRIQQLSDVVWLQTAFIGDIILNMAACSWLKLKYPLIRQHLITTKVGASALKNDATFATVIAFDKSSSRFLGSAKAVHRQLDQAGVDRNSSVILQTHRSFRSSFLARYLAIPTVTYFDTSCGFLAARRVRRDLTLHETMRDAQLFEPLGISLSDYQNPPTWLSPLEAPAQFASFIQKHPSLKLIGVATGSVWPTKRWLIDGFAEVVRQLLIKHPGIAVVLLGGNSEANDALSIQSKVDPTVADRFISLVGQTSLADLRGIYARLTMVLSNDSSPVQYASAFNVPTVAIFGPTVPRFGFGPLASNSQVVQKDLPCRPCSPHGPMRCPLDHFNCMRTISASEVLSVCDEMLDSIGT